MTQPTLDQDKARLAKLGEMAESLAFDEWGIMAKDGRTIVTTRRHTGEDVVLFQMSPDALSEEIEIASSALEILRLLFRTRGRSVAAIRDLQRQLGRDPKRRDGDFAANAAMLTDDRRFQRFLESKGAGGPVRDKTAADTRMKSLLAIKSKTELNHDARAQAAWIALRTDYETWLRGGQ
jgi:hypothetical protein